MDKNWYKNYDQGVPHTIDPDQYSSFVPMLEEMFEKYSNQPCFINFDKHLTYKQVDILSQRFAGYLQSECNCVKGDRIAMLMLNTLQYPVAIFGALRAGLIVVGISPLSQPVEVNRILNETEPKCVLVLSNLAPVLESALALDPAFSIRHIIVSHIGDLLGFFKGPLINFVAKHKAKTPLWHLPNVIPFKETIKERYQKIFIKPPIEAQDPAFLDYTSGRDSPIPKCVIYTHRSIVASVMQLSAWFAPLFQEKLQGTYLVMMPIYLTTYLMASIEISRRGYASSLITNPLSIPGIINEIKNHDYFGTLCISRLLKALLLHEELKKVDFSNLKFTGGWGGFFGIDILRWKTITGTLIMSGYGGREIHIGSINPYTLKTFNNKVGLPLPSIEIKICDENGNELPHDSRGELWIRGPQVISGYWKNTELTKTVFTDDGWFKTGDIMTLDGEGFLGFIDRKSDVIMTAVEPVYPSDIEVVIAFLEGVQEVAVTSQNSKQHGQIIKAFIVKNKPELSAEAVKSHCRKYLLEHQIPQEVEFREQLPKTDLGYLFRRLLREEGET
jgi:long-chain acyl-CoA synthetase